MNILLTTLISLVMTYEMPKLPYANNGLEPVISQATIDYHYGKHLQTYVNNLNSLVPSTEFEGKTVEEIVASAPDGAIFNNAGQVLNHTLYFLQFTPKPNKHEPSGKLAEAINRDFGSFENFKKEFKLEYKQGRKAMPTKEMRRMYSKPILPTVLVKSIKFKDKTRVVKSYPNVKFAAAIGTATGFLLATWGSIYWRLRRSYR